MIKTFSILIILFISASVSVLAQDISVLEKSAQVDLEKSLEKLSKLRNKIAQNKIPLAKKIRAREESLRSLRREVIKIQELQDSKTIGLEELRRNLKFWRDENIYLLNLLSEYERGLEQNLNLAEYSALFKDLVTGAG